MGADGRHSTVRRAAGLEVIASSAPMDVLWFALSRRADESLRFFQPGRGRVLIAIDRGSYWQVAYVIPAGQYEAVKAIGIDRLRESIVELVPGLSDHVSELAPWDDVRFLRVSVDRLRRWYRPGLLCIGDAAHAMSPAGGVGINLAIQDAVATANLLSLSLRRGAAPDARQLSRVQRRRELPTRLTQLLQIRAAGGLYPKSLVDDPSRHVPWAFRLFRLVPALRHLAGRFIGLGLRAEHVSPRIER